MSVAELSAYTSISKYARYVEEEKRRESWEEAVGRNEGMMLDRFPFLRNEIVNSYNFVRERKVLGSMRAMQFGGKPALKHNARMYNCTASYCDRLRFFQECFYLLLCGCGTGFSVQEHHVAKLPQFSKKRLAGVELPKKVFRIEDCIEGWSDAQGALLSSYHEVPIKGFEEYQDCDVVFDPSPIRPKGAPLSCGIGRAPGPDPLMYALEAARQLLNKAISLGVKLTPLQAYDLVMYFADASVAGGVRRSATICIFSPWDLEMATSKTGNWMRENPQRARSNNSAALLRNSTTWEKFFDLFQHTRQFGEPGFYWTDDYDIIPNPCVEVGFWPRLMLELTAPTTYQIQRVYDGPIEKHADTNNTIIVSGWQMCNLSTLNGRTTQNKDDFYERCGAAATIGTLQAAFTSFPYLGTVTEKIVEREALLGVAICGMMHKPKLFLDPETQLGGAKVVLKTNERIAKVCGIQPCARGTCIKPDGKSSAILESEPGIHPGHSRRYFRIVQVNQNERPYQHFKAINPQACEKSVWSKSGIDDCIRFCIEEPEGTVLKSEITAIDMQGKDLSCVPSLR
jgi:ribonucleoside-triphosphate reductase